MDDLLRVCYLGAYNYAMKVGPTFRVPLPPRLNTLVVAAANVHFGATVMPTRAESCPDRHRCGYSRTCASASVTGNSLRHRRLDRCVTTNTSLMSSPNRPTRSPPLRAKCLISKPSYDLCLRLAHRCRGCMTGCRVWGWGTLGSRGEGTGETHPLPLLSNHASHPSPPISPTLALPLPCPLLSPALGAVA